MAAVVVTDSLDWRLHGFDLLSEHSLSGELQRRLRGRAAELQLSRGGLHGAGSWCKQ